MQPKGILFDLDDTITTFDAISDPTWREICEEYAGRCGLSQPGLLDDAIAEVRKWYWSDKERHRSGRLDLDNTRRTIVVLALQKLNVGSVSLAHEIADNYSVRRVERIDFIPGAEDRLQYFVDRGVLLALVTNGESHKQRGKIERFGLERFFKTILIEGELGYGKPDERVFLRALSDLGLGPDQAWSVGDNLEWDVAGPQKLGIFSIWNDFRKKGLPPSPEVVPDRIIHSIAELPEE